MPAKKNTRRKKSKKSRFPVQGMILTLLFTGSALFFTTQLLNRDAMTSTASQATQPTPTAVPAEATAIPVNPVLQAEATEVPVTLAADSFAGVRPEITNGFLPVCSSRYTNEKIVAITIDDCNEPGNLTEIINLIYNAGGQATLFPLGTNVAGIAEQLRDAVSKGFEIENHTYNHSGLYSETDEQMAQEIWQQNRAVSEALGVNYQMHFLRPRGGDNRYDQRTHNYLRQLNYCGIAYWSQVGSERSAQEVMFNLEPGNILLFHTTNEDLATLQSLIPMLVEDGWRMITLNEMYNLPANAQSPLEEDAEAPAPTAYERQPQTLRNGDYLHDVLLMQEKLAELGYLTSEYNGYFGNDTESALRAFQRANNLGADGLCGAKTWQMLFSEEAIPAA